MPHRTPTEFTAGSDRRAGFPRYIRCTVILRGGDETRRWQPAIAVAAALGVFIALVAGSALRPACAAAALPEPPAWTAPTAAPPVAMPSTPTAARVAGRPSTISRAAPATSRSAAPANNTNKKPFHSTWMTKERPLSWNRLSPHAVLSPMPISFSPLGFAPRGAQSRAPAIFLPDRDVLTLFGVARR
ncbi:hypothetical protein MAVA5_16270 [Mycobacterium avium subsp. hominissuis A5]|nr:hypothetical protein MAVA5_16270 [Mycobacterium avium subsp. hominissuis A5]